MRLANQALLSFFAGLFLVRLTAAADLYETRFAGVTWDNDGWKLESSNLDQGHYQARMSLANGYIGINVAALGPFFEYDQPVNDDNINGWPVFDRRQTFATVSGFWAESDASYISGIPHWAAISLESGGEVLSAFTPAAEISNFTTTMDMRLGLLHWAYQWKPAGSDVSFDITYQMFLHKLNLNQALVQMTVTSSAAVSVNIYDILNGDCAVRSTFADKGVDDGILYSAVKPNGIDEVTAYIYSKLEATAGGSLPSPIVVNSSAWLGYNESSIAQTYSFNLEPNNQLTLTKYIGIASTDGFSDPQAAARNAVISAAKTGYDASLKSHQEEWACIFFDDLVDDYKTANGVLPDDPYIQELAVLSVVNPFLLLQNTVSQNALALVPNASVGNNSIPVGGLGSDSYGGLIFWDADLFMHGGLVATFPEAAKSIPLYRARRLDQARLNVADKSSSSTQGSKTFSNLSAVYPWTSSRYGNCLSNCFDYEYHISGDIVISTITQFVADGDIGTFTNGYFPVLDSVAAFYADLLTLTNGKYDLTSMTDPDEYANYKDNGGYTMPLIASTLNWANQYREQLGMEPNAQWATEADWVDIPTLNGISLEYSGMSGDIFIKQADVILKIYPLLWNINYTTTDAVQDFTYYSQKQNLQGPAMTFSPFSIVANQIQNQGCAGYTYQNYGSNPYLRAPFFQMSEQMNDNYEDNSGYHPAFPFLTGHGADYQVALFGYLGLQYVPDGKLHINPVLPPQISRLRYRRFYWQGWPLTASANLTHTILTRLSESLPNANQDFTNKPIPVIVGPSTDSQDTYSIPAGGTIVVPNRLAYSDLTVADNVLQCAIVKKASADYNLGQFPMGAVDGYNITQWQPASASVTSSLTVEVPAEHVNKTLETIAFNWQTSPPLQFTVSGSNSIDGGDDTVVIADNIAVDISQPYDASSLTDVAISPGNQTVFTPSQDFNIPRYVTLSILGNQASADSMGESTEGATVAEWAMIATTSG
ncbi:Acid trehalase [Talaromyces islandicus]|uniref:alpha,alpha-trehalase n=1 Tax=Talaromyces islandicus TaxID=28573 RepID=A0A0U1LWS0_TALIS|nr:Acid trehalase [Talaromyces islandicus]